MTKFSFTSSFYFLSCFDKFYLSSMVGHGFVVLTSCRFFFNTFSRRIFPQVFFDGLPIYVLVNFLSLVRGLCPPFK